MDKQYYKRILKTLIRTKSRAKTDYRKQKKILEGFEKGRLEKNDFQKRRWVGEKQPFLEKILFKKKEKQRKILQNYRSFYTSFKKKEE